MNTCIFLHSLIKHEFQHWKNFGDALIRFFAFYDKENDSRKAK